MIFGVRASDGAPRLVKPGGGLALPPPAASCSQRPLCTYVENQIGDRCVGEGNEGCRHIAVGANGRRGSPLDIYNGARAREAVRIRQLPPDIGCQPSDAIDSQIAVGIRLRDWRDDDASSANALRTPEDAVAAFQHRADPTWFVQLFGLDSLKAYLTLGFQRMSAGLGGIGVQFCMPVDAPYQSLTATSPTYAGPQGPSLGGHCQVAIGYQTIANVEYVETWNSWGSGWGEGGFSFIRADRIYGYASQFVAVTGGTLL